MTKLFLPNEVCLANSLSKSDFIGIKVTEKQSLCIGFSPHFKTDVRSVCPVDLKHLNPFVPVSGTRP